MKGVRKSAWIALAFLAAACASSAADGWANPEPGHVFKFPADSGAHPQFRIEWWYITGHLHAKPDRRFGFQATFFRAAGPREGAEPAGSFGTGQLFLAQMALTDVSAGTFVSDERLNREGWDAQAAVGALDLRNAQWNLRQDAAGVLHLEGSVRAEASFTLSFTPAKPLVIFGENGVSPKGPAASAASYYLSYPRLETEGMLTVAGSAMPVRGEAWMDHEISSNQLGPGQVGWDWACIQLKDSKRELMLYRLRLEDGRADPASRLQWVSPEGKVVTEPFRWQVLSRWTSPRSGAVYPSRVRISTVDPANGAQTSFELVPLLPDQEIPNNLAGGAYWEGACRVLDAHGNDAGASYLELTGYAKALKF